MSKIVIIGKFGSPHGIRGWLNVHSYTIPFDNILSYPKWLVQKQKIWAPIKLEASKLQNEKLIVKLQDIDDRNEAQHMTNSDIGIDHSELPQLENGEYYWTDLIGLKVVTLKGFELGKVEYLFATGSNDVLVIKDQEQNEHLVPYLDNVVKEVDLSKSLIVIDWDSDF